MDNTKILISNRTNIIFSSVFIFFWKIIFLIPLFENYFFPQKLEFFTKLGKINNFKWKITEFLEKGSRKNEKTCIFSPPIHRNYFPPRFTPLRVRNSKDKQATRSPSRIKIDLILLSIVNFVWQCLQYPSETRQVKNYMTVLIKLIFNIIHKRLQLMRLNVILFISLIADIF